MGRLTITEVARRTGISASAIRYYEEIHLLPAPQRINGRRCYTPEVIERLTFIQTAQSLGFSLADIKSLSMEQVDQHSLSERWQKLARTKLHEVQSLITQARTIEILLARGLNCQCSTFDECMDCIITNCQP